MSANENEIVWTDSSWRVVRASHGALYVERERLDAMRVKTWVHADVDEQMGTLSRCVSALHDRVKKAEAGLERFREVVEAKLPEYGPGVEDWRAGPVGAEGVRLITEMTRELAMAMSVPLPVSWAELITKAAELEQSMGKRCVCCGAPPSHHPNEAVGCDAFAERRWKDESKAKPRCLYRHEAGADLCQLEAGHDGFGHPALSRTTSLEQASIASLRAELTALGKHVEDVERRAYDTPTKAAFGDCLNKTLEVEQRIRLGEEMAKRIDQKLDTRANAISIDYYAMRARIDALEENRPSPKPDNLGMTYAERLALASAGKAETLEAVLSLTDALQALGERYAGQERRLAAMEEEAVREDMAWENRIAGPLTERVEALGARVDTLREEADTGAENWGRTFGELHVDVQERLDALGAKVDATHDLLARTRAELDRASFAGMSDKREAVIREHEAGYREAPLDLATLRVPGQATGVSETAVSFRPAGHALDIVTEVRVLPGYGSEERHEWVTVGPSEARLLARALTQWADEKEAKGAPSPQAYEPDSEDGS